MSLSPPTTRSQDPLGYGQVYVRTGSTQRPLNRQYARARRRVRQLSAAELRSVRSADRPRLADLSAKQQFGGASVLAEWDVGPGKLTSVSAYRKWDWGPANDRDFIGLPITTDLAESVAAASVVAGAALRGFGRQDRLRRRPVRLLSDGRHGRRAGARSAREPLAAERRECQQSRDPGWPALRERHRSEEHQRRGVRPAHLACHRRSAPAARPARQLRQEGRQVHRDGHQRDQHAAHRRAARRARAAELSARVQRHERVGRLHRVVRPRPTMCSAM